MRVPLGRRDLLRRGRGRVGRRHRGRRHAGWRGLRVLRLGARRRDSGTKPKQDDDIASHGPLSVGRSGRPVPGAMQRRVVGHQRAMPPDVPARVRVPTPLASRVVMAGELSRHGQPRPATHDLATVREQPSQLPADRNLRVMAGEGRPPATLLCGTKERRGWPAFAGHDTEVAARSFEALVPGRPLAVWQGARLWLSGRSRPPGACPADRP